VAKTIRRSPRRAGVAAALVVAGAVGLLLVSACGGGGSSDLSDGVVARVGDANITQVQLDRAIAQGSAAAKASNQTLPTEGQEGFDQLRQQALRGLVVRRIIEFEARDCGTPCAVSEKDIDAGLQQVIKGNFSGSQKQFDTFLVDRKISLAEARDSIKDTLQQSKLKANVTRGIRFTDAEAKAYYDQNIAQFKVAAGRRVSHILVPTKAEADKIRAEVTPQNFAELARKDSTDATTKDKGGDLGALVASTGLIGPEFDKAASALKDGEISQPVKTQFGWHIITVDTTPAHTTSFAEAKTGIIASQLAQKREQAWSDWQVGVLKKWDAKTVYADPSLKPAPTPTAPTATTP
jgi:parvulin-like peptidyl-prolyl isomerase